MRASKRHTIICASLILLFVAAQSYASQTIRLLEKAEASGILLYWDSLSETGLMEKNGHQISFRSGDSVVLLDNRKLSVTDAPVVKSGALFVSQAFIDTAESFFRTESEEAHYRVGAILIDPGHGGKDPGASQVFRQNGTTLIVREKDVTLAVGKMLYAKLKTAFPDKKIILTRDSDTFLSLGERTDIANSVQLKKKRSGAVYFGARKRIPRQKSERLRSVVSVAGVPAYRYRQSRCGGR